jgi:hypothetical protein
VDGTIEGDVVVINGDFTASAGSRIGGSVTVAGGEARALPGADVRGRIDSYRGALRYRVVAGRLEYVPAADEFERGVSAGLDLPFGRTDIVIAQQGAYNRAEGLAVGVGPRARLAGEHPVRLQALLIGRTGTAAELDQHRFGYDVLAEQLVQHRLGITLGAGLHSLITPIEQWQVGDREAALAAFLLRRDYRDHYEREGWSAWLRMRPTGAAWSASLEYRDEEHSAAPPADPFSLLNRGDDWRPQPLIAEGALSSLHATLRYDTRNEERDPSTGWLIDSRVERGLRGGVRIPQASLAPPGEHRADARSGFLAGSIDVRRYARLTPYSRLNMRVVAAGSLDARALPPQRQHVLGGEGSMPGYRLFQFDCGARDAAGQHRGASFYPYYGCDRSALVQIEYLAGFPFARRMGQRLGLGHLAHLARWSAFFDAGRAWIEPAARAGRPGGNDDFSADAGVGVRFGPLGAYWAVPLSGHGQAVNFFVRLAPRI